MAKSGVTADVLGAVGVSLFLVFAASFIEDTTVTLLVTPIVLALLIYAIARSPLRHSMLALMFLALAVPSPADVPPHPTYHPPGHMFAAIAFTHWNSIDRTLGFLSSIAFGGMDICLVALLIVAFYRESTGSKVDRAGRVNTPKPLVKLAYLSLAGTGFVWLTGILRGGDFGKSLWQLNCVLYLPALFLLYHLGLRGPKDLVPLAKVFFAAASYKAGLAIYVINTVKYKVTEAWASDKLPFATGHQDSILFSLAMVLPFALLLEKVQRPKWLVPVFIPLVFMGIVSNNRRLAWVQVALVFVVVFVLSRKTKLKTRITRTILIAIPIVSFYALIGWDRQYSRLFKPVQIIKSVVDAKTDGSSFWRELENWNLIFTLRTNPINYVLGTGYGHPYQEIFAMPAVPYELEHFIPHNSLLGLWCFCGYVGYTMLTLLWCVGVYFAMRAYQNATVPEHRAGALMCFASVLVYMIQCWGDIGLATLTGIFTVAPSLAMAGKLAVATGQWGSARQRAMATGAQPA
jgi:hypothetical protein